MKPFLKHIQEVRTIPWMILFSMLFGLLLGPNFVLCKGLGDHLAIEYGATKCCSNALKLPGCLSEKNAISMWDDCSDTPIESKFLGSRQPIQNRIKVGMASCSPCGFYVIPLYSQIGISPTVQSVDFILNNPSLERIEVTVLLI